MNILKKNCPVGLACDHAGYELKEFVVSLLKQQDIPYIDFGTFSSESCNYAQYAHKLAFAVEQQECYPGIAICGSGNGIGMTLNKHQDIRAALCWMPELAQLARSHNDANVCVMPGRFINQAMAEEIVSVFLHTSFEGGRHQIRIDSMSLEIPSCDS